MITYINISTTGNSVTFGNLQGGSGADRNSIAAVGSQTRAMLLGGGSNSGGISNQVQTVEIHSLGNAADFGDLTNGKRGMAPGSNLTRAVVLGGGYSEGARNEIDYFTFTTAGNATDFGDLSAAREVGGGLSSSTRTLIGGGSE